MKRKTDLAKLKKKLDAVFSKYIRKRDGYKCFTCYETNPSKMQCGHYEKRHILSTRYDERNCNSQCVACNLFRNGNYQEYAVRLQELYGVGILEELRALAHKRVKYDRTWYEEKIEHYTKLLEKEEKNEEQECGGMRGLRISGESSGGVSDSTGEQCISA